LGAGAVAVYLNLPITKIFSRPNRPPAGVLEQALDSAYARIEPQAVSTSRVAVAGRTVRQDLVELARSSSTLRANLEITREVEKAGGEVAYGIESRDTKARRQVLTLGISDGDTLVCEVRLERRTR